MAELVIIMCTWIILVAMMIDSSQDKWNKMTIEQDNPYAYNRAF